MSKLSSDGRSTGPNERELFLTTLEIHRRTLSQPKLRLRNIDVTYDARLTIEMARRLSLTEITNLGHATELREQGLALARAGNLPGGSELIAASRHQFEHAELSPEALLLAEWFQMPAEAYVQYRCGDTVLAEESLMRAIEFCVRLRTDYGYRVELRRIHLTCNVVRVRDQGGRPLEALELGHHLIDYIQGVSEAWPWPSIAVVDPDALALDVRLAIMDQVLGTIGRILSTARPDAVALLGIADARGWLRGEEGHEKIERARIWLFARSSAVRGDWDSFLQYAAVFFAEPSGRLRIAWHELTGDLVTVGRIRAPHEVVECSIG
jgi:hypothetical protein